ncbi:MAG: hypothetical protein AABX55_01145 [Nanoarchaeota archaeon]
MDFLRGNLEKSATTIFDTNIFMPLTNELVFSPSGNGNARLEELASIFDKAYDYQDKLSELISDSRIIITNDIVKEMVRAQKYWKHRLNEAELDRRILNFLKESIREYASRLTQLYNAFNKDRVASRNDYDINTYYNFRIFLMQLLEKCYPTRNISTTDKSIIYIMINKSLSEPTGVISRDKDLFMLTIEVINNKEELEKRLKKFDLKVTKKINYKYSNTYILSSNAKRTTTYSRVLPYSTSNA